MKKIRIELLFVMVALLISIVFIFNPSPGWMFSFIFIAQPLFLYAMVSSLVMIYRDLKSKEVI